MLPLRLSGRFLPKDFVQTGSSTRLKSGDINSQTYYPYRYPVNMRVILLCTLLPLSLCSLLRAQGFQTLFPGLNGDALIDSISKNYRPLTVLDYANARDTLYAKILAATDDSLRCIYSGHTLYLDPNQDPTQYIYQNGGPNGMNTEHAYPQGKGAADGNARSDMHHIYPARIPVNEARGESPYSEIPDQQTTKWFKGNQTLSSIPAAQIETYSEFKSGFFEPREFVKGDLARSVFYFYTMYRAQANAADPAFFELQRPTLCQWTHQDPVDSVELQKNWAIAAYQDGKPNPYVIDCTLASRSWCPDWTPVCLVSTQTPVQEPKLEIRVWPNPTHDNLTVSVFSKTEVLLSITDLYGKIWVNQPVTPGDNILPLSHLPTGLYLLHIQDYSGQKTGISRKIYVQ